MQTETSNPEPPKSVYSGKKLNFIKDKTEVQRKRGFESSIKNACRNFLCMPNFKGLSTRKEFTEYHVIYFAYFLGTVLSPRNFIRNVYSPTQQQLIHTLWRVYVPEFFKDFCTNINNAIILGDENKNAQSLKIIRVFVTNLNSEQKTILKCKFQDNASKIQMIYSKCFQTHYYNTNTCGLNTKLVVEAHADTLKKRAAAHPAAKQAQRFLQIDYEYPKPKPHMSEITITKTNPNAEAEKFLQSLHPIAAKKPIKRDLKVKDGTDGVPEKKKVKKSKVDPKARPPLNWIKSGTNAK